MLDKCFDISCVLSLKFNVSKSHCVIIGKIYKTKISPMLMGNQLVEWCHCIKYLSVYLVSSSDIMFDNPVKHCFYAACNSILSHSSGVHEIALLTLQESYSLSVLMYVAPALALRCRQIEELNACWNGVFRKIFGYSCFESVKQVIHGIGRWILNIC